jgi:amino acid permease
VSRTTLDVRAVEFSVATHHLTFIFHSEVTNTMSTEDSITSVSDTSPVTEDVLNLESFGYKQELKRDFSLFGMIGFAFSVLTCWTALGGSLVAAIEAGGPPVIIYSWIGVSFFSLFVAYSFAEICSAFPVAVSATNLVLRSALSGSREDNTHGLQY